VLGGVVFPGHTAKVRARLAGIIGEDAAQAAGENSSLRILASCIALLTTGMAGWAEYVGGGIPRIVAILCGLLFAYVAVIGVLTGGRVGKLARQYVSDHYGLDLRGYGGGSFASGWQRSIDRARKNGWTTR
jgi:hypothetical protein